MTGDLQKVPPFIWEGDWCDKTAMPESMYLLCSLASTKMIGVRGGAHIMSIETGLKHNESLVKLLGAAEIIRQNREEWEAYLEDPSTRECYNMQIFKTDRSLAFAMAVGEHFNILHLKPGDTDIIQFPDSLIPRGKDYPLISRVDGSFGGSLGALWIRLGHPKIPQAPYNKIYQSIRLSNTQSTAETVSLAGITAPPGLQPVLQQAANVEEDAVEVEAEAEADGDNNNKKKRTRKSPERITMYAMISHCLSYAGLPCTTVATSKAVLLHLDRLWSTCTMLYALERRSGRNTFLSHLHRSWPQMVEPTIREFRKASVRPLDWLPDASKNLDHATYLRLEIHKIKGRTQSSPLMNRLLLQHIHDKLLGDSTGLYRASLEADDNFKGVLEQLSVLDLEDEPVYRLPDHFDVTAQSFVDFHWDDWPGRERNPGSHRDQEHSVVDNNQHELKITITNEGPIGPPLEIENQGVPIVTPLNVEQDDPDAVMSALVAHDLINTDGDIIDGPTNAIGSPLNVEHDDPDADISDLFVHDLINTDGDIIDDPINTDGDIIDDPTNADGDIVDDVTIGETQEAEPKEASADGFPVPLRSQYAMRIACALL